MVSKQQSVHSSRNTLFKKKQINDFGC